MKALGPTILLAIALAVAPAARAQAYSAPLNPHGQPDLAGYWSHATSTTLERDPSFGDRRVMTPEEAEAASEEMVIGAEPRTSFLVAPSNGRLPELTPAARAARADRLAAYPRGYGFQRGDHPEGMTLAERCLRDYGSLLGPPMMPVGYNNNYQIIQSPDHVVIVVEMVHDARIIPLKGKHRPDAMKPYLGDSIGWWDGDTLVVETINLHPNQQIGGGQVSLTEKGKITERFTRYNDNQVLYEFEVDDPTLYTQVWKGEVGMNKVDGNMYEYACHEGNYGLEGILAGGRANDRAGKNNRVNGDRDEG